jgi:heparan-alpha-glucosaminide N-acetyltransferase
MAWKETPNINTPKPNDPKPGDSKPGDPRPGTLGASAAAAATPDRNKPATTKPTTGRDPALAGKSSAAPARLVSLDAYRGAIMLLMASGGLGIAGIVKSGGLEEAGVAAGSTFDRVFRFAAWQLDHVVWQGGVFWDLIQPAFMFMVGVALPYSYAARAARGDSYLSRFGHMLLRSFMLIAIAVFLSTAVGDSQTNFVFMNVLAQIGLGYPLLFLFVNRPRWLQVTALVAILAGSWYAYYQHPLPPADFDYTAYKIPAEGPARTDFVPEGMWQHWAIHTNFGTWLDRIVLNAFPRNEPFDVNNGGYATFNFVPSLATMLLGLIVGELLRSKRSDREKMKWLGIIGAVCLAIGFIVGYTACPIVKRIWTPSWMLTSGGAVIWMLAVFYWVFDVRGWKRLAWPLAVVGMNSIALYMMAQLLKGWTGKALKTHLALPYRKFAEWMSAGGTAWNPEIFGGTFGPVYQSLAVLFCFWLVCVWMYRRKIFIRL